MRHDGGFFFLNYGVDGLSGFPVTDAMLAANFVHVDCKTDIANMWVEF